jgi:uncharacterized protein
MDQQVVFYCIAGLLIAVGVIGTLLPVLPGMPLVFAGMLLAAWANGFEQISGWTIAVLGVMTLFSFAIDFFSTSVGAKRVGASRKAIIGALLGTIAGLFFGPIGLFAGPFIGAMLGELLHQRKVDRGSVGQSAKVGVATWVGIVLGTALKLGLAFAMIGLFLFAWYF